MSLLDLPIEILYAIVTIDFETWRSAVLSMPFVYRTFPDTERIRKRFDEVKTFVLEYGTKRIEYRTCGKIHRENGPAVIVYFEDYQEVQRNDGAPDYLVAKGKIGGYSERWYRKGRLHREGDSPAIIDFLRGGKVEQWYREGRLHREKGPAKVIYYGDGGKSGESWYEKGELHREDGPACVEYHPNGTAFMEEWYERGTSIPCKLASPNAW